MTQRTEARAGPPLGRHVAAVGLTVALIIALFWLDGNPDGGRELPLSHQVLAGASLVLLCLILMLGACARFVPRLRPVVPWGRELGIAMFVTGGLHAMLLFGLDLRVFDGLVGESRSSGFEFWTNMWAATNWVGLFALAFASVLAATSNDWSQRLLGRSWKFLQRQAYNLFVLVWLHTAAFVVIGVGHGASMWAWLFWAVTGAAVIAQLAGFVHTAIARRPPSQHRVPPKASQTTNNGRIRALRWTGVLAIWVVFTVGSWSLATTQSGEEAEEEAAKSALCERVNDLFGLPITSDIRTELETLLPEGESPDSLNEYLETC